MPYIHCSDEPLIGSYGELNTNCGFNRISHQIFSECFQWHRDRVPKLKNSLNATVGEVPWIVKIVLYDGPSGLFMSDCTASLIGEQWLLTAAHCVVT